jgi:PAS domain S-box-containing protein
MARSEQTAAEQILFESENQLRLMADSLPSLIAYVDRDQRYQFNNKAYEEWFGLSPAEIKGKHLKEVLGTTLYETIRPHVEAALSGRKVHYEAEIARKGEAGFFEMTLVPHTDGHETILGFYVLGNDITARKRSDKARDRRLAFEQLITKISATFVNIPAGDVDMKINDGLRLIGESIDVDEIFVMQFEHEKESSGLTHGWFKSGIVRELDFEASEFTQRFPWGGRKILNNERIVFESLDELPSEAFREKELLKQMKLESAVVVPLSAGGTIMGAFFVQTLHRSKEWPEDLVHRLGLISDIFANALTRRNAEHLLHLNEERFRIFMDNIPACIYMKDRKRHIYANRELLDRLGLSLDEFVGTSSRDFMDPEACEAIERADQEIIEGKCKAEVNEQYMELEGHKGWWWDLKFPIAGPLGEKLIGGVALDITERKQAEEDLRKAYSEIKQLKERLETENLYLRKEIDLKHKHGEIIGESDAIKNVLHRAEQVAETDSNVLLMGETGTGKELLARSIHALSHRKDRSLVTVNCSALPPTLIESELFGREKGAFTGALSRQVGRFEVANGSTIFLDEIGELSTDLQVKLLRVLEEGEFERLGSTKTRKVDVRVIAATNRDLMQMVQDGQFRDDLFYRLNVFPIAIPPLRDRRNDILLLTWAFIKEFGQSMGKTIDKITRKDMEGLQRYAWPGNVRELRNVIERAMILARSSTLPIDLPEPSKPVNGQLSGTLAEIEKAYIVQVLGKTNWRIRGQNGAAETLGLKPTTLHSRMQKLGIRRPVNPEIP